MTQAGNGIEVRIITPDWENATATDPGDFTDVALLHLVWDETEGSMVLVPFGAFPRWSPTTDQILFSENPNDGPIGISVITPDGEADYEPLIAPTVTRNTTTSTGQYSAWSPDGTQFAYTAVTTKRNSSASTVSIYDIDTGGVQDTDAAPPGYVIVAWRPELP